MQSSHIGFKMREKFMKNNGIFREIQMHRLLKRYTWKYVPNVLIDSKSRRMKSQTQ